MGFIGLDMTLKDITRISEIQEIRSERKNLETQSSRRNKIGVEAPFTQDIWEIVFSFVAQNSSRDLICSCMLVCKSFRDYVNRILSTCLILKPSREEAWSLKQMRDHESVGGSLARLEGQFPKIMEVREDSLRILNIELGPLADAEPWRGGWCRCVRENLEQLLHSVLKAGERCSRLIIFILFINTDERLLCTYDSIRNFARYMLHPKKICSFSFSVPPCLEVFKSNCVVTLNSNTGRTSQLRLLETGNLQHTNCRYNRVIHMHQISQLLRLQAIQLNGICCTVFCAQIPDLIRLKELQYIGLRNLEWLTVGDWSALQDCPSLSTIFVECSFCREEAFHSVLKATHLKELSIDFLYPDLHNQEDYYIPLINSNKISMEDLSLTRLRINNMNKADVDLLGMMVQAPKLCHLNLRCLYGRIRSWTDLPKQRLTNIKCQARFEVAVGLNPEERAYLKSLGFDIKTYRNRGMMCLIAYRNILDHTEKSSLDDQYNLAGPLSCITGYGLKMLEDPRAYTSYLLYIDRHVIGLSS